MSDGQFSSKPIRSGRRSDFARGEFSSEAMSSPDAAKAFLMAPAVRREVNALLEQPFPQVGELGCAPFPRKAPHGVYDFGRPIASAVLVQEYLIGLVFLRVCGWFFLLIGGLMLLGALAMVGTMADGPPGQGGGFLIFAGLGLGVGGAGLWFGILRGRVVNEMCWFCPHGMVWMTESIFEWYGWEEVPEVYCTLLGMRPAVGLRFDGAVSWISFSNTRHSRLIVDYIENRASAAWIEATLQAIAEGKAIAFGRWRLRKSAIEGTGKEIEWRNVLEIERSDRDLVIHRTDRGHMVIPLDEIPFPSMFTALARAMYAYARQRPA